MCNAHESSRTPAERVGDIPKMLHALRLAIGEALLEHKRAGNPVPIWQDGRVVWVQPEDIPVAGQPSDDQSE